MDYKKEVKILLKEINRLEEEIEKPLYYPNLNEIKMRRNLEAWLEHYRKCLNEITKKGVDN